MTNRFNFRTYCKLDNTIRACNTEEDFKLLYDIIYNDNEDYIILQSTGLLDRKDVEIFEGDLIKTGFVKTYLKIKKVYSFQSGFYAEDYEQYEFEGTDPINLEYLVNNNAYIEVVGSIYKGEIKNDKQI